MREDNVNIWKGIVAGLAGGLIASWTMNQFQAAWTRLAENSEKPHGAQSMQPSDGSQGDGQDAKEQDDDATVKAAKAISEGVFGHELQESEKKPAGAAVHYAFGTVTGGLYGGLAEVVPQVTTAEFRLAQLSGCLLMRFQCRYSVSRKDRPTIPCRLMLML
jgi:hypothetical protein